MKIINRVKLSYFKVDKKSIVFALPILFFLMISFIVINADTTPVSSVEINSNYTGQGSWSITKSAEWTELNKARITLELNTRAKLPTRNKDIILVIDVSGSMSGSKLDKVKEDTKDLIDTLLTDSNNRVAIITFSSTASKLSDLTNNASNLDTIVDNLTASGETNYNAGLLEAKSIIENYTQVNNKDLVLLFLTDGYPNKETPNQVSTFEIMKEQYSFVTYSAVQYEMGTDVVKEIEDISDNQYVAYEETLNNVLFEASVSPVSYDSFSIEDYISSYFEISSITDINPSYGTVNLTTESGLKKITWNLGSNYRTGRIDTLTIDVNLKSANQNIDDVFETNDHTKVTSKLSGDTEKIVNSTLTPILPTKYSLIYQTNTPTGCTLSNIASEKHKPYETVTIRNDELSCSGYVFRGFEVEEHDVTKINNKKFIMPGHNVTIRAIWTKADINASMDGEVATGLTLYKVIRNEYKSNSGYAKKYTGEHKDSFTRPAEKDIYYFTTPTSSVNDGNTLLDKINVIFAGYCWQMIRTTDTGGVKLLYNGVPVNDKCEKTRSNVNSLNQEKLTTNAMSSSYSYGSDFTYDLTNGTFKIAGTIKEGINYSNDKSVIGYYTCKNADKDATCATLYYLEEEYPGSSTTVYVLPITIVSNNYQIAGKSPYNVTEKSPALVGYMYNKVYNQQSYQLIENENYAYNSTLLPSADTLDTSWYYADTIDIGNINPNQYTLINPTQWSSGITNLVGKYMIKGGQNSGSLCYVEAINDNTIYCNKLGTMYMATSYTYSDSFEYNSTQRTFTLINSQNWSNGVDVTGKYVKTNNDYNIYYVSTMINGLIYYETFSSGNILLHNEQLKLGESITDNGNGTYTLNNTIDITLNDWFTNYDNYKNKYTCGTDDSVCANPRFIVTTTNRAYSFIPNPTDKILIAKARNGLVLTNTLLVRIDELSKNGENYTDYKYTCNTQSSTCTEDTLRMIISFSDINYSYYANRYAGESASWDGIKYTLVNTMPIEDFDNISNVSNHHYVCIEYGQTECTSVGYIHYYATSYNKNIYYILLENGVETVDEALNEMLYNNNVNLKDSSVKRIIDIWYQNNMTNYDSYIEETIYCNNRSIIAYNGWQDDNSVSNNSLSFYASLRTNNAYLNCQNETDQFSINNNKAKLKYKVGLETSSELHLMSNLTAIYHNVQTHLMTPFSFNTYSYVYAINGSTLNPGYYMVEPLGFRPVISLAPGVAPSSGTGTMIDPYVIDTSGN